MHKHSSRFEERFDILNHVFSFAEGPLRLALSWVHADFRNALGDIFVATVHKMMHTEDTQQNLGLAAKTGRVDLCELAITTGSSPKQPWGFETGFTCLSGFLHDAGLKGNRRICEFAHRLSQKKTGWNFDWIRMFIGAAHASDPVCARELGALARQWALEAEQSVNGCWLMAEAAKDGDIALCKAARSWCSSGHESPEWEIAIDGAIIGGYLNVCQVALAMIHAEGRDLDHRNYEDYLYVAARTGRYEICLLLHENALASGLVLDYNPMFNGAEQGSHANLCDLAREWGATE